MRISTAIERDLFSGFAAMKLGIYARPFSSLTNHPAVQQNHPRAKIAPPTRANGFTLIELLVVVFIIGLASAAVILTLPGGNSALRADAEQMAARIAASRDEAVLQSRPVAAWFRPSGYGFEQRRGGQWLPAAGQPFRQVGWTNGTQIASVDGSSKNRQARVVFDQTGLPSGPVNLLLRNDANTVAVNVSASGDVSVGR